jgi:deoxyribodipyrimidine photo-lyase
MTAPVILWFRRDLRLRDHAALTAAMAAGPVIPVFVLDDETPRHRRMGGASRWWLHHGLLSLDADLRARGSRLVLRRGVAVDELAALARQSGAAAIHCIRHHEPWWRNAERALGSSVDLVRHDGNYLLPPGTVRTGAGEPFRLFAPFYRATLERLSPAPARAAPDRIDGPEVWPSSDRLEDWALCPRNPDWATGFRADWLPGEAGAQRRIDAFLPVARSYEDDRNLPPVEGTSRLSPHLHFGDVSPATVWGALGDAGDTGTQSFRRELIWRDYAQSMIAAFPDYGSRNGRASFDHFPWRDGAAATADLRAWQQGLTGYPIVDAGMRQLWATGWMHNRVRMIAASFLVKHLLIDWRGGERWFWDTLVDADYGNNSVNWQWVSGTGHDSGMFSRIMAPILQSRKFGAAAYIRRWVPELAHLDDDAIHDPDSAGRRPSAYPAPVVAHAEARHRALDAYASIKGSVGRTGGSDA